MLPPRNSTHTITVATVNSAGRQAASFIRAASAVGWHVRGQIRSSEGLVADELGALPNVTLFEGPIEGHIIDKVFHGAQLAFINTTHWGDEVAVGMQLADAAKRAGIRHYIYSSMPDHSSFGKGWKALPLWEQKAQVETYIRSIGLPATFIYCGIYNNNFTSLPYPLFRMELQPDGQSFVWKAPFSPDEPLPWVDAEHDVGPAVLQIFKQGLAKWGGHRIPLAFERLTPTEVCQAFSVALNKPVTYQRGQIAISVPIPKGYREHLEVLEEVLGDGKAPYFGPDLDNPDYPAEAVGLWWGFRGIEEYAREVFPFEERDNGLTWMNDEDGTHEDGEDDRHTIHSVDSNRDSNRDGTMSARPGTSSTAGTPAEGSTAGEGYMMGYEGTESAGYFTGNT